MARVLVVDDNQDVLEALELMLTDAGHAAHTASGGRAGIDAVRLHRPDVVLLDMMMPDVDGLQFLGQVASHGAVPAVIACSGFERFEGPAMAAGALAFLRKPFDACDLFAVITAALEPAASRATRSIDPDHAYRARERAQAERDALLTGAALNRTDLAAELRDLVHWTVRYFGVARSFVTALHGGKLHVLAEAGGAPHATAGERVDPEQHFCPDVVRAGSRLVLEDVARHAAFAEHPAAEGVAFYAAAPLVSADGVSLGTYCLEDVKPLRFPGEDLSVVGHFAQVAGRQVHAVALGMPLPEGPFESPGLLRSAFFEVVSRCALRRAEREGQHVELTLLELARTDTRALRALVELAHADPGARVAIGLAEHAVTMIVAGADGDLARARTDAILSAASSHHLLKRCGIAIYAGTSNRRLEPWQLGRIAEQNMTPASPGAATRARVPA